MSSTRFLLVALFLLLPSGPQNNPVVTWSPSHLTKTALIGTSSSVDITFTCARELNNVTLRVVPELATVVSITPSSFERIESGTVQTVRVTFSVPKNEPVQTLRGTIQLKEGSKTIAQPLPIMLNTQAPSASEIPQSIALPSQDRIGTVPNEDSMPFVTDEITIVLKDGVGQDVIMQLVSQLDAVFLGSMPEIGFYQIVVREEGFENLLRIASQLQQEPNIDLATLHFLFRTGNFPNDPGTDLSYGPDLVKLPLAWDIITGKKGVIIGPRDVEKINIAVVDTVFDFDHADLKPNITKHTPNSASFGEPNHGTRVASIVGAKGNNGIGIAGAMWDAALHLYSAGDSKDSTKFDSSLMTIAFSQAIRDGARVVNFSGGQNCGQSICSSEGERALQEMDKYFEYFINLAKSKLGRNLLWVFAAGNENKNLRTQSPARLSGSFDNVVSVSAVDSNKKLASFSNFGRDVTVAAPGVRIFTLVPGGGFNDGTFNIPIINWKLDSYGSGTSYSAPYVTGVAGLMLSVNPNLTASQLKSIIKDSTDSTGNSDKEGNEVRLLNAFRAVQQASGSFQFLSFVEGSPGLPGDGVIINATGGEFDHTFDLTTPYPVSSAGQGFTATVFPPKSVQNFQSFSYTIISSRPSPCTLHFGAAAGGGMRVQLNNVFGYTNYVSPGVIESWVDFANLVVPGCNFKASDLRLKAIIMFAPNISFITTLDAAAIGQGPNGFPGVPAP